MSTLNSGFRHSEDNSSKKISQEDRDLIDAFIREKGVTQCPPSGADGNEISPSTHEFIMQKRKEYRAKQRAAKKGN